MMTTTYGDPEYSNERQWGWRGGMSVPAMMNLTEYCRCTSKLQLNTQSPTLNRGRERLHAMGVLMPGLGLMPLHS